MPRLAPPAILALALAACGGSKPTATAPPATTPGCAAWETTLADGSCQGPGVPPGSCGAGFAADGRMGCAPILPATDCADGTMAVPGQTACAPIGPPDAPSCVAGQMAVPGETTCRPIADCGAAPWGSIPVDATTQFVDGSYTAGGSDGTAAKPWTTIGAALNAAPSGAIVAVAAGVYAESVVLGSKPAKLWGRCPSMVTISTTGGMPALAISGAVEVHQLALTGAGVGARVAVGVTGVVLDRIRAHDLSGVAIDSAGGFTLSASLVESSVGVGVHVTGAHGVIDHSVVRSIAVGAGALPDGGIVASSSTLDLRASLVHACFREGVLALESDVTVDGSVVRDIDAEPSGMFGIGIDAESKSTTPSTLVVTNTLVARAQEAGVLVGGNVTASIIGSRVSGTTGLPDGEGFGLIAQPGVLGRVPNVTVTGSLFERNSGRALHSLSARLDVEASVVRDTVGVPATHVGGTGISSIRSDPSGPRPIGTIRGCLLERNRLAAVVLGAADVRVDASVLRATLPQESTGTFGVGVEVLPDDPPSALSNLTIERSVIAGNQSVGVFGVDVALVMDATVVQDTQPRATDGLYGDGIRIQPDGSSPLRSSLAMTSCLLEGNTEAGVIAAGADLMIATTEIRDTHANGGGGDGLVIGSFSGFGLAAATATITTSRIETSARAGITAYGATVSLSASTVQCNAIDLDGEVSVGGSDPYQFSLESADACGCAGALGRCQVLSSNLAPPSAL